MSVKISELKIENVKRVRAVKIEPSKNGLTVIGGKNNQGKTSVLDSIAWALGGNGYRPAQARREGSVIPPHLHVVLSNGLIVERSGKNSDLKVTDPKGNKGGQQLLNEFVEQLALDLPKFMRASDREKADTLLKIIGVGDKLAVLERREKEIYNQRHRIGQSADPKGKFAKEMEYFPNAPDELVSVSELLRQQQEILARNGENQRKRDTLSQLERLAEEYREKIDSLLEKQAKVHAELEIARKSAQDLQDESTAELEKNIAEIETINRKVRINLDKDKAEEDAQNYRNQYAELTQEIEATRKEKMFLLESADLPYPGLSVENGILTYQGRPWDNMSGSDQLKISTAIVRKLNPECGFVLLDKLEQMDMDTLQEFGEWLEKEGLQAIATRVSTSGECSIIIEDGYVKGQEMELPKETQKGWKTWKAGEF